MGKRQSGKDKVLASLKEKGPQTVAELVESTGLVKERVRYAVDGLAWAREIHCSHEMRQIWNGQAHIFVYGLGPENEEPDFYRLRVEHHDATAENQRTVERIRNSYIPGIFDPFRVLRVQVGA
ncbi:hypothetical protein MyNCGM121_23130 [Achromobacter xylosoxidans]